MKLLTPEFNPLRWELSFDANNDYIPVLFRAVVEANHAFDHVKACLRDGLPAAFDICAAYNAVKRLDELLEKAKAAGCKVQVDWTYEDGLQCLDWLYQAELKYKEMLKEVGIQLPEFKSDTCAEWWRKAHHFGV